MRNQFSFAMSLLVVGMVVGACTAADNPKPDPQLQKITEAHEETVKRVGDLQGYKPTPEELAANAIRIEKHVTMSEKTGKIKMISYRTFRGERRIKDYLERDTNDDGKLDFFMQSFRADGESCAALTRSLPGAIGGAGVSVFAGGVAHVTATFIDKDSDGQYEELLLMRDDGTFIDLFRRDAEGVLQPVGAEEYLQARKGAEALAPFMGATLGVIDGARKEQQKEGVPNKSVEPTPTR